MVGTLAADCAEPDARGRVGMANVPTVPAAFASIQATAQSLGIEARPLTVRDGGRLNAQSRPSPGRTRV